MACDVDELDINPFFRALQAKFSDLYDQAQKKCYTICIPQSSTICESGINTDFAETHILKPSPYFKGELLTSHSQNPKSVTFEESGQYLTTGAGFASELRVKIISEELAYNKEYKQYRILILNQPLDPKFQKQTPAEGEEAGKRLHTALERVDQGVRLFSRNYMVLPDYLTDAASRLEDLCTDAVELCLRQADRKLASDLMWRDVLGAAVESYILGGVHEKVFEVVCTRFAEDDQYLVSKIQSQLQGISAKSLGIKSKFACPLPTAVAELKRLDDLTTPREQLYCLKSVIDNITAGITSHLARDNPPHLAALSQDEPCLTSDDLIPIMVSVIAQTSCPHLQSHVFYMENFVWASSAKDDLSYCLVTFKAAVQYILSTDFSHLPRKHVHKKQVSLDRQTSSGADRLSVTNGHRSHDRSPSPRYGYDSPCYTPSPRYSPVVTASAGSGSSTPAPSDRLDRQLSRISRALEQTSVGEGHGQKEQKVKSIFGAKYDVPVALEVAARSRTSPQLGDFLSSLQDDFMDQPFGKQA
ncbi:hypothetical protein BaRGS_00033731 [Batillaria attramentaria]|uniref:VPS9 domain-containing protein n=1 Tax=Batillaria attramentaria TaxID=370345 RepID=A0ABD0JK18_9CAEN